MEELHIADRDAAEQLVMPSISELPLTNAESSGGLDQLWEEISHQNMTDTSKTCQALLLAQGYLQSWGERALSGEDESAVNNLYDWAGSNAIPSSVFNSSMDEPSSEGTKIEHQKQYTLAISVIELLSALLPVHKAENTPGIILTLAGFTSQEDAWTTVEAYAASTTLLESFTADSDTQFFWITIESILKNQIKPRFSKTKNPSLTPGGRKNFHPVPLPRFDMSILDPETKPWKLEDVATVTAFTWIVNQYKAADREYLEVHFPLLVPPILSLIDDDSLPFKRHGCILLSSLLAPIRDSQSDILRRTNLSSVFEDAIRPCFLSLPTITPEDDSIQLLEIAYPALRSLLQTSYGTLVTSKTAKDKDIYLSGMTKTMRENLISSFHHISSTNTTSASTFASFPHPRLSTLLLQQIATTCTDLGIHTTKYLQEIVPLLYSTLSNTFGTGYPPLLLAGVAATRAVILNGHPRIWRWRGELLGAICSCWLHVVEDEEESNLMKPKNYKSTATPSSLGQNKDIDLNRLKKELQGMVYLLKFSLENPSLPDGDEGVLEAKENIARELRTLIDADETLKGCLAAEVDPNDPGFFGLDP